MRDQNGNVMANATVVWSSGDVSVAAVDGAGLVTAAGNGTATITASAGQASGNATVTVAQVVSRVTVSASVGSLVEGDTLRFTAEVADANGHAVADAASEWSSTDTLVATVDESGLATGVGQGEAEIVAISSGVEGRAPLAVVAPVPTTVKVTPDTARFAALGQSEQLAAEVLDQAGRILEGASVSWSSSDTAVAVVDSAGLVTATGNGVANVTATSGTASRTMIVVVMQSAGSVIVSPAVDTVAIGETLRLMAEAFDENGHRADGVSFTWSSSEVSVARVDTSGLVQGVGEGTAEITVTAGKARGTAEVTVENPDRAALVALYEATGGPNWANNDNWLTEAPLEDWHGVYVGDGRVRTLDLPRNNLAGSLPPELGQLSRLATLNLDFNRRMDGAIPPELGDLVHLEHLGLQGVGLTGRIPPELGRLSSLRFLFLAGNDLVGPIPPELGNLSRLEWLSIYANNLSGPIPVELGELSSLTGIELQVNELSGPIPTELGNLPQLERLVLAVNELSGPIPPPLGGLGALQTLIISNNHLTGALPAELGELRSLRRLAVNGNTGLSGPLPLTLTQLSSLMHFRTDGTDLCAPSDPGFQQWLVRMPDQRVILCDVDDTLPFLTQAIQSREFPVPLVAGDAALLRVFPKAQTATEERIPPVRATFYLDGAEAHVVSIPAKSALIPTEVDEGSLDLSSNAGIPGEVVQPGLEMVVEIDPEWTLDAGLGVAGRIPEEGRIAIDVRAMPTLDLTLIPFLWETKPDSTVLDLTDGITPDDELFWDARFLLPIAETDLKVHDPVLSSSNEAHNLISQTEAIRVLEGATGHYMGLLSGDVSGAAGLASVPGRASFAIAESRTMAHELGHNLSLFHAPCGASIDLDPTFPYPDGSIGFWGYDFRSGELRAPDVTDLMGYCHNYWVSEYHFSKALRFRLVDEGGSSDAVAAARSGSLLLWGGIDRNGVPFLEPAFVVDTRPVLPQSTGAYTIVGSTEGGNELFALGFDMPEVPDGNGSSFFTFAVPVQAGWAGALASITLSGPGGSFTLDGESNLPTIIVRDPATGQVRGILRNPPAAFAAGEARALLSEPGLQMFLSRGIPDAAAWRR